MMTRRGVLRLALALPPVLVATAACAQGSPTTPGTPGASGSPELRDGAYRHGSGLLVVTRDYLDRHPTEEVATVVGLCDNLTDLFPDEFGFAFGIGDAAMLGIATDRGQELYDKWRGTGGLPADARPDPEGKFIPSLNEQGRALAGKTVRLQRVDRSRAKVEELQHGIDLHDPAYAAAKIGATHIDRSTSIVIIHMETLTDEAANRLVQLYGTRDVAILLQPYEAYNSF